METENKESELAFNLNGEAFEPPIEAIGWRVRRMKPKGAPEVVYGRGGTPLVLDIDAGIDELRSEAGASGRYRLDPVDENNKPIANAQAGYVFIHEEPKTTPQQTIHSASSDSIVIEAMRMNSEIAKSVVDKFPQMMEAAATLLRAADGAGLPARPGTVIDVVDEDDDEPEATPVAGFDLATFLAQMMPVLMTAFSGIKKEHIAPVLDWRKAGKSAAPKEEPQAKAEAKAAPLPPLDPAQMAHVVAIQSQLEPLEVAFVQEVAKDLGPTELREWFDKLSKQSVPEAVTTIRGLIAGKKGGAS